MKTITLSLIFKAISSNFHGLKKGFYRIAVKRQEENEKLVSVLQEAVKWQK